MLGAVIYLKCKFRDWQFVFLRPILAELLALSGQFAARTGAGVVAVKCLLTANRFSNGRRFRTLIHAHLDLIRKYSPELVGPARLIEQIEQRCLILAEPQIDRARVIRKGVLLVKFTETSGALFASVDPRVLTELFHVVLEPSSAGYADPAILCWLNVKDPVLVQTPEHYDRVFLESLGSNLVAVPYGSGDWIDPSRFSPPSKVEKKYDAICVANFGWWKRVHVFLRGVAIASSQVAGYQALLVLASYGRTRWNQNDVERLLSFFGIRNNVKVMVSVPQHELSLLYSKSKVCVMPSLKEGSSRVIFEAMSSDIPVFVLAANVGVKKEYIHSETGVLVREQDLARELVRIARNEIHFSPRAWFVSHLGPLNTTRKLEADLDIHFPGEGWAQNGLHLKTNAPEAVFLDKNWNPRLSKWINLRVK